MTSDAAHSRAGDRRVIGVIPGSLVSGAEAVLLRDLVAARDAGWSVRVACSDGPFVDRAAAVGVERVEIPDLRLAPGSRAVAFARLAVASVRTAWTLRRALAPNELVLANGLNVLPACSLLGRRHRIVYFGHDVLIRRDRLALLRLVRRSIHLVIAVSDAVARSITELRLPTEVIHNGTAWPVEPAPARDFTRPAVVGVAAVVTPWKGQHVLLDAVARMHHRNVHVEIMGATAPKDEAYAARLRARSDQPDLRGRVTFLGHVDDPLARMRTWAITVLASVDPEAGPLTALEAMSIGVPVVGTDHGGMVEVIGDAGLLVPPDDADALGRALDRLLDDADLWTRCHRTGPEQITHHALTLADHERAMLAALERCVRE